MRLVLGLAAALFFAACADSPTSPPASGAALSASGPRTPGAAADDVTAVCATSQATPRGEHPYAYGRLALRLPGSMRAGDGGTRSYRYEGYAEGARLVAVAVCDVPDTPAAVQHLERLFGVQRRGSGSGGGGWDGPALLGDETVVKLDAFNGYACQYGGEYPHCDPAPLPTGTLGKLDQDICQYWEDCGGGDYTPAGGGSDPEPAPEEDASRCPDQLFGRVVTALIPVAGRNHEFKFSGPMNRVGIARSPATYQISGPTTSTDNWWMAASGTISVYCNGYYTPWVGGARYWIGRTDYAGRSDLHMVMSAGHPDF